MDCSSFNADKDGTFLLITNIPHNFHSKDLRNYFSYYIDKSVFHTFHYRHRPEASMIKYLRSIKDTLEANLQLENPVSASIKETKSVVGKQCLSELSDSIRRLSEVIDSSKNDFRNRDKNKSDKTNIHFSEEIVNSNTDEDSPRCCALIFIKKEYVDSFKALYNWKFWITMDGIILPVRCLIFDLTVILKFNREISISTASDEDLSYLTKSRFQAQRRQLAFEKMNQLIEFQTPYFMPQGNVGTPNSYFKSSLNQCKLPASIISKLGLDFNRRKPKKKYSQVHLNYGTGIEPGGLYRESNEAIFTENGDLIPGYFDIKFNKSLQKHHKSSAPILELENEEEEEGAETEEWDRFEAFHDDVTKQERTKERLFESEIELVWEKGGSGLVFYTDAQFWRVYEGGEEERNIDEWDLDITPYYEGGEAGDLDARASLSMSEMDQLKAGTLTTSVFAPPLDKGLKARLPARSRIKHQERRKMIQGVSKPVGVKGGHEQLKETRKQRQERKKLLKQSLTTENKAQRNQHQGISGDIGNFEEHTKGIGRRVLEAQGWKEGEGLGRERTGMAHAIVSKWKHPLDKTGFGYSAKTESREIDSLNPRDSASSLYRAPQPNVMPRPRKSFAP